MVQTKTARLTYLKSDNGNTWETRGAEFTHFSEESASMSNRQNNESHVKVAEKRK